MSIRTDYKSQRISDEQIIEMYWQRDEMAIHETDKKYGKMLFKIAYNILRDKQDCEQCKNDTYIGIWNAIPPARPAVFPAFITQIVRRISINKYKEKTSKKRIPSELTVSMEELENVLRDESSVDRERDSEELGRIISDYIRSLSDKEQYIFVSRYYMAESVEKIAGSLNVTKSSVYKELTKIKQGLKIHLANNEVYL